MESEKQRLYRRLADLHHQLSETYRALAELQGAPRKVPQKGGAAVATGPAPEAPAEPGSRVKAYLARKKIEIINHLDIYEEYGELVELANFIAGELEQVEEFLYGFKRNQESGGSFFINLEDASPEKFASLSRLGQLAQEAGLLARFKHLKRDRVFVVQPNRSSYSINFITGKWLELYVWDVVNRKILRQYPEGEIDGLFSAQIAFPNGDEFEIDALLLVRDRPLWIEAKTGEFTEKIPRFSEIRKQLGVDPADAFLLAVQPLSESSRKAREKAAGMRILPLPEFEDALQTRVAEILNAG